MSHQNAAGGILVAFAHDGERARIINCDPELLALEIKNSEASPERAREAPPQVCLLDIGLPEMDGSKLAQCLRAERTKTAASGIAAARFQLGSEHISHYW